MDAAGQQLTPSQQRAVSHVAGPLLVVAGPGSGKTRVVTFRIAALIRGGVAPASICAITFTNKASDEMRQRAQRLGASAGAHISTFHSLCVRILRRYADAAGIRSNFSIYDDADQTRCIRQAIQDCGLDKANFPPSRMLAAVSTLKNKLILPEAFRGSGEDYFSVMLARVYERYQQLLAERNSLDFDDLLMKAAILLESHPGIRREMGQRFQFLLIDEYQDTNHAQYRIAKALASCHGNICATGDPDQSIYRWRGADIRNILAFEQDWPDATVVKLEENFRSTAPILEVADRLIAFNRGRKAKRLIATRNDPGRVDVADYEDEAAEAAGVAFAAQQQIDQGTSPRDVAVLYRVNAMSRALEEAFIRRKIPYQIVRGIEFYNRKEIRDLLAYLKVLANPSDDVALTRIINTPARGIGKVTLDRVAAYAQRSGRSLLAAIRESDGLDSIGKAAGGKLKAFADMLERLRGDGDGKVASLARRVLSQSGLEASLLAAGTEGQDAIDNVNELINAAAGYDEHTEQPSLVDYLQQISLFSDTDAYDSTSERVALMTLHAAKGLEFESVFIVGLEDGLLPHERSSDDADELEEERRLLFVGITRAKTRLAVSHARYRTVRGQSVRSIPSPFLFELGCGFGETSRKAPARRPAAEKPQSKAAPFTPGQLVRHRSFGLGRIQKYVDLGPGSIVVVRFNTGETKSLMVEFADLSVEQVS